MQQRSMNSANKKYAASTSDWTWSLSSEAVAR